MKNFIKSSKTLALLAPYLVASGAGFQVGAIFAVASSDAANGADVVGETEGVFALTKTSAQAWTVGQKIYWDNGNKRCDSDGTVGMLIGTAHVIAANPSATGEVILNGTAPASAEGPQGAIVALTDSTGGSGTHDDTLADGLTVTAPAALTATALGDLVATQNTGWGASTEAGFDSIATKFDALLADVTALHAKIDTIVTDLGVQNQNDSDVAQKILEIRTALIAHGVIAAA